MKTELHEQARRDDDACDVRRDKARVVHNLQNSCGVVLLKAGLIKGVTAITERMIHIDEHVAIHRSFGIDEGDFARKIFRNLSPYVTLMREYLQRDTVGLVITRRAHRDHPLPAATRKSL